MKLVRGNKRASADTAAAHVVGKTVSMALVGTSGARLKKV
jgi:hypothetical protein